MYGYDAEKKIVQHYRWWEVDLKVCVNVSRDEKTSLYWVLVGEAYQMAWKLEVVEINYNQCCRLPKY